jgi:hypothetical protein
MRVYIYIHRERERERLDRWFAVVEFFFERRSRLKKEI